MRKHLWIAIGLAVLLLGALVMDRGLAAPTADGDLDPTFGSGGKVTTGFPNGPDSGAALAVQTDGKIVVAGPAGIHFALARYLANGSLDPTFGQGGRVVTSFNSWMESAAALGIQPDGKILVAGTAFADYWDSQWAVARYNADGSLDSSFGAGGEITIGFGQGRSEAHGLALQRDGRILLAGLAGGDFAVARLLTTGVLDPSFGSGGKTTTNVENEDGAYALRIQLDGRIILAGYSSPISGGSDDYNFALVRYNADGSLDTGFGGGGKVITDFNNGDDLARALTIGADGKIVAAGSASDPTRGLSSFALARYLTNGSLDPSFGTGGKVTTNFGPINPEQDGATGVAIQANGRIVALGVADLSASDFALARYLTDGSLDASFGTGGRLTTDFGGADQGQALALTAEGKLIAAGAAYSTTTGNDFALARYTSAGQLDSSFGTDGKVTTNFAAGGDFANAVALQPDGKIVVAGSTEGSGGGDYALARYNPDGTLDSAFGSGGQVTTDFEGKPDSANALLIQPDGKIVAAGSYDDVGLEYYEPSHGFGVVRYLPNGQLDPGFGSGGKVATELYTYGGGVANALALQADGKIVVAGTKILGRRPGYDFEEFAVGRYNPDGTLDSSFGTGGLVFTSFGDPEPSFTDGFGYAVAIQPDGKIVVGGNASSGIVAARYNPDGSLDPNFGDQGLLRTNSQGSEIRSLLVQPDGKIVAGGYSRVTCSPSPCDTYFLFTLVRYLPDGTLDPGFGANGIATSRFAGADSQVYGLVQQADGKIIAAGSRGQPTYGLSAFALARFNGDGSVDPTFGNAGQLLTTFGGSSAALGIALQPDGKIVAAGYGDGGSSGNDFALVRYQNAPPPPPTPTIGPGCLFSDVCPGDYFFPGVQALLARGALSGYADQTFRPYNQTTRGQMVKIVTLGFGLPLTPPPAGQYTFADVPPSQPFFAYIETAAARNIVGGYTCGGVGEPCDGQHRPYFRPAANVTRGQLAKIVVTAAGWPMLDPASGTFADVAPGSAFYQDVETAVAQGILSGYGCGGPGEPCDGGHRPYFRPGANATRGQIAKIVANALPAAATPTPPATSVPATPTVTPTGTPVPASPTATPTGTPVSASLTVTPTTTALPPRKGGD